MPKSTFDQKEQNVEHQQNAAGHIYNISQAEQDALLHEEIVHNASFAARTLMSIGWIACVGAFALFFGAFVIPAIESFFVLGFPVFFVGMIAYAIGYQTARNEAYKRRSKNRQK